MCKGECEAVFGCLGKLIWRRNKTWCRRGGRVETSIQRASHLVFDEIVFDPSLSLFFAASDSTIEAWHFSRLHPSFSIKGTYHWRRKITQCARWLSSAPKKRGFEKEKKTRCCKSHVCVVPCRTTAPRWRREIGRSEGEGLHTTCLDDECPRPTSAADQRRASKTISESRLLLLLHLTRWW